MSPADPNSDLTEQQQADIAAGRAVLAEFVQMATQAARGALRRAEAPAASGTDLFDPVLSITRAARCARQCLALQAKLSQLHRAGAQPAPHQPTRPASAPRLRPARDEDADDERAERLADADLLDDDDDDDDNEPDRDGPATRAHVHAVAADLQRTLAAMAAPRRPPAAPAPDRPSPIGLADTLDRHGLSEVAELVREAEQAQAARGHDPP